MGLGDINDSLVNVPAGGESPDTALNTIHRGSDGVDHSKVDANETATGLNTTHRGVTTGNPHNVKEFASTVYFDEELDNGNSGSADTIDLAAGNKQKSTLTDDCTYTFDPVAGGPCSLIFRLIQGGAGGFDVTWPGAVTWLGTEPTWTDGVTGKSIIVSFYFDGTIYWAQSSPWEV